MLEELKEQVYNANMALVKDGLVILTWGNVSGFDPSTGLVVIKPSGIEYSELNPGMMVVIDLDGNIRDGNLKPSSDASTHIELYRSFQGIKGVVHTHSTNATSWAQAGMDIPVMGTTHADYFYGDVPCTRKLTEPEIKENYELNTGRVIVETFINIDPLSIPSVIVNQHGPFSWGENPMKAIETAIVLEEVAKMAAISIMIGGERRIDKTLLDKHFLRKHGKDSYYGQ